MTSLRREVLKSVIPLVILAVIATMASKAIGGWAEVIGAPLIVIGSAMFWGRVVRRELQRGGREDGGRSEAS